MRFLKQSDQKRQRRRPAESSAPECGEAACRVFRIRPPVLLPACVAALGLVLGLVWFEAARGGPKDNRATCGTPLAATGLLILLAWILFFVPLRVKLASKRVLVHFVLRRRTLSLDDDVTVHLRRWSRPIDDEIWFVGQSRTFVLKQYFFANSGDEMYQAIIEHKDSAA